MAIPEFVLKKLVLPGSLKRQGNGFSFILKNTFAPATIQRFALFINQNEIPAEKVSFSAENLPKSNGTEINVDHPMLTPVGVEILIEVDAPLVGVLTIKALTKEVGEIEFSLTDSSSKKRTKNIKPVFLSQFSSPLTSSVEIDPTKKIGSAHPFLLGQFIEHLERCIYDGIWTEDGSKLREDTLDLIKQLNPPVIRYPGGNFASGYHWEDGIGPNEKRPRRHDAAWQAEESNLVGTDEFLAFCDQIGTEPIMVVNDGSGTAEEAARWVAYCNEPATTEQGKRRAANGHPEPYGVKYWGIGNEVWGAWQIGTTSAQEYVNRMLKFIKAMKQVDPTIKIIAVGNHPLTDDPNNPAFLWNKEVLSRAGEEIDYLSWHIYQPEKDGWNEQYDPYQLFATICAAPIDIDTYLSRIEKQIAVFSPKKDVLQALDEWNVWLPPLKGETSMHQVTYTMRDALYVASALAVFYRRCKTLGMTNLAQMVNVLPLIKTNSQTAFATTIFYPFILFNQMESGVLETRCQSPAFSSMALGENITDHKNIPYLDQLATISEDQNRITLMLVNRAPEKRMKVELNLANLSSYIAGEALQIGAAHPLDANTFDHPYKVKITSCEKPKKKETGFEITLKPASVTLVEFKRG